MTFRDTWLRILFPAYCPICDTVMPLSEDLVHPACIRKLHPAAEPTCLKCGKPVLNDDAEYCSDCDKRKHQFTQGRAVWVYDSLIQASLIRYKYHGAKCYTAFYADAICRYLGNWILRIQPEVLIPVPVNWRRKNHRGYNQAALLSSNLSKRLGIPTDTDYLLRSGHTAPQKQLSPLERYRNLKQAFHVKTTGKQYKKILLVDDIYTTGSTMDACAAVLRDAGVESIYFVTLAIGSERED